MKGCPNNWLCEMLRLLRYWVWWLSASSTTEGRSSFAISSSSLRIRQHTSAFVSIRQHTSAYVSIRQRRTEERSSFGISASWLLHTSDYVSVRQHSSENVRIREDMSEGRRRSSFGISSSSLLRVMSLPLTSRLRRHALVASRRIHEELRASYTSSLRADTLGRQRSHVVGSSSIAAPLVHIHITISK